MVFYHNLFIKHSYFCISPHGWLGIVVREVGLIVSKYIIKKLHKMNKRF